MQLLVHQPGTKDIDQFHLFCVHVWHIYDITKSAFFYKHFFICNPKLCINQAIKVIKSDFFDF